MRTLDGGFSNNTCLVSCTEDVAINEMKRSKAYKSDKEALDDFLIVYWANIKEE